VLLGAHSFERLLTHATGVTRRVAPAFIVLSLVADLAVKPSHWERVPLERDLPRVFQWLRDNGKPGAVLILPPDGLGQFRSPLYLYYAMFHHRPLLNGYPAFMPAECHDALIRARNFPQPASLEMLSGRGIRYVVLDVEKLNEDASGTDELIAACLASPGIRREDAASDDKFLLFEVLALDQDER